MTKTVTIDSITHLPTTLDELSSFEPLHVKLIGSQFHGSLTSSVMKGLVELQEGINRSYCFAKYGSDDLRKLTDIEIKKLELIVTIEEGSTDIFGDITELINSLKELLKDMTPKQKFSVIMAIIIGLSGCFSFSKWIEHANHVNDNSTKVALEQEHTKQLDNAQKNILEGVKLGLKHNQEPNNDTEEQESQAQEPLPTTGHFKIINKPTVETLELVEEIRQQQPEISDTMDKAQTKFVRSMKFADTVVYNKTFESSGDMLEKITQPPRNTWKDEVIKGNFRVLDIGSQAFDYRTVSLRTEDGRELIAKFTDKSITKQAFNKLSSAMYGYNPINLSVRAKSLNGKLKDGHIEQIRNIDKSRSFKPEEDDLA